jgi:hypothetical protein
MVGRRWLTLAPPTDHRSASQFPHFQILNVLPGVATHITIRLTFYVPFLFFLQPTIGTTSIGSYADPDSPFYLNADPDPDPVSKTNASADPDPGQTLKSQKVEFLHEKYS